MPAWGQGLVSARLPRPGPRCAARVLRPPLCPSRARAVQRRARGQACAVNPACGSRPAAARHAHDARAARGGRWRVVGGASVCGAGFLAYRALRGLPLRQILMLVAKMKDRVPEQVEAALNSGERSRLILVRPRRARTGLPEFAARAPRAACGHEPRCCAARFMPDATVCACTHGGGGGRRRCATSRRSSRRASTCRKSKTP